MRLEYLRAREFLKLRKRRRRKQVIVPNVIKVIAIGTIAYFGIKFLGALVEILEDP